MNEILQQLYPNRIVSPMTINDIPNNGYMVYILAFNNRPIALGHGQRNRAKIIFDNENQITTSHLKALFVRLYNLYGNGNFERYIINCQNKDEAKLIERNLHNLIGGNNRHIPNEIRNQLFNGLDPNSVSYLVLEIALRSSFDGLSDIRKWRADGILSDAIWTEISQRLHLN
jgi:hypothetical protein